MGTLHDFANRRLTVEHWRFEKERRSWPALYMLKPGDVLRRRFKGDWLELVVGDECYYDRAGRRYHCLKEFMAEHISTVQGPGGRVVRDMSQRPKRFWRDAVAAVLSI